MSEINISEFLNNLHKELEDNSEESYRLGANRFFKEQVVHIGVRAKIADKIAREFFRKIKDLSKPEIFKLCEKLMQKGAQEETGIALNWAFRIRESYSKDDFKIFEKWLFKYVSNWGSCDDLCTHSLGYLLKKFPGVLPKTKIWAASKNRWARRASCVSLIPGLWEGKFLKNALARADYLMKEEDDMVRKGMGWMLKEASRSYPEEIFSFLFSRKKTMPRVSFRYALEKLPLAKKRELMAK